MYKVLLVDDEKIIRIALKSMIDWEEHGFTVCATASNGHSALELIQEHQPHLVLVDIMMPEITGLELIKQAKQNNYNGQFIILTNHSNFNFAIEAIHQSVLDYLVKTDLSQKTLINILEKAKEVLDSQEDNSSASKSNEITDKELQILNSVAKHGLENTEEITFSNQYLFLEIFLRNKLEQQKQEYHILTNTLKNLVQEVLENDSYLVIQYAVDTAILIVPQEKRADFISNLPSFTKKIQQLVKIYMNTDCGFVCSNTFNNNIDFDQKLRHLQALEPLIFFCGFDTVINEEDAALFSEQTVDHISIEKQIKLHLTHGEFALCKEFLHSELKTFARKKPYVSTMKELLSKLYRFLIFDYSIYLENSKEELQKIANRQRLTCTFEECFELLCTLIDLIQTGLSSQSNTVRNEILLVREYIQKNLDKKLTLAMVAEHVNMTENYLSRLFKTETGMTLVNYINYQKMEHAKMLLINSTLSIKEISFSLGYSETSYFNKLFNKIYGLNPSDYRKMLIP